MNRKVIIVRCGYDGGDTSCRLPDRLRQVTVDGQTEGHALLELAGQSAIVCPPRSQQSPNDHKLARDCVKVR